MNIAVASDHGGYNEKEQIVKWLREQGHKVRNFGTHNIDSCDYPDYAKQVCDHITSNNSEFGILVCGTGIGMSMVANRNPQIRAGLCSGVTTAELTRQHNNANVLCLGARVTLDADIIPIVETFLNTEFEGGRHTKRIEKF
ncbi:ribose 5-phosphate isomerase B [bacterium]|nr:ribose 5-phosphate isomerase B [bacterium]